MAIAPIHQPAPLPRLMYRIRNAAEVLGVKERSVREWMRMGRIHAVRFPTGGKGITHAELERFVESLQPNGETAKQ